MSDLNNNSTIDYNLLGARPKIKPTPPVIAPFSSQISCVFSSSVSPSPLDCPLFPTENSPIEEEGSSVEVYMLDPEYVESYHRNCDSTINLVECEYCNEKLIYEAINKHERLCKNETDRYDCPLCQKRIRLADLEQHQRICVNKKETLAEIPLDDENSEICSFCQKRIFFDQFEIHKSVCVLDKGSVILCQKCDRMFVLTYLDDHQQSCLPAQYFVDSENLHSRIGRSNCPRCRQAFLPDLLSEHEKTCNLGEKDQASFGFLSPALPVIEGVVIFCTLCQKFVLEGNFTDHQSSCGADKQFFGGRRDDGESLFVANQCSYCKGYFEPEKILRRHEASCELNPNKKDFFYLEEIQPTSIEWISCPHCSGSVLSNELECHLTFCKQNSVNSQWFTANPPQAIGVSQWLASVDEPTACASSSNDVELPCEFCRNLIPASHLESHQASCSEWRSFHSY